MTVDTGLDTVRVSSVSKRFGFHRALTEVSLEVRAGELCALLGANGAGKSTLLGIVSTLVKPTSGLVQYERRGKPAASGTGLRREIGVLSHDSLIYPLLTALENLEFWGRLYQVPEIAHKVRCALEGVGLPEDTWNRPASTFSRGMLQRLALARALLPEPSLLLLDEPFTGLDRHGTAALSRMLQSSIQKNRIILVVTHDLAAIADITRHVAVLQRGRLAFEDRSSGFSAQQLGDCYHDHSGVESVAC